MKSKKSLSVILSIFVISIGLLPFASDVSGYYLSQQPTISIPTVTGTPLGVMAIVNADQDQINVRNGPGTTYSRIGVLLTGQAVPAKGRSVGGEWVQIEYPGVPGGLGWVHSSLISLTPGSLPVIEPPSTPTPLVTATIDPTLAAQFIITAVPTRLPTYTLPPPLEIPTQVPVGTGTPISRIPMGLVIIALAALGAFGAFISFLQGR